MCVVIWLHCCQRETNMPHFDERIRKARINQEETDKLLVDMRIERDKAKLLAADQEITIKRMRETISRLEKMVSYQRGAYIVPQAAWQADELEKGTISLENQAQMLVDMIEGLKE